MPGKAPRGWKPEPRSNPAWADDVIHEESEDITGLTWLRHVPTQVIMWHYGRSHAETLEHLGHILHSHGMIELDEVHAAVEAARAGKGPRTA
jgi:hypothetical protein